MIGRELGHYRIRDEISRGGMGVVYRTVDLKLNREVARYFELVTRTGQARLFLPLLYVRSFYFRGQLAERGGA